MALGKWACWRGAGRAMIYTDQICNREARRGGAKRASGSRRGRL